MWKKLCGGKFWSLMLQLCFAEEGWAISKIKEDLWTTGSWSVKSTEKTDAISHTVSTAWWGAWQINNSSFIRLINRILILQIAFLKRNKVQARGTIRKINSSENWSWHKKNYFHCKSSKTGLFKAFELKWRRPQFKSATSLFCLSLTLL